MNVDLESVTIIVEGYDAFSRKIIAERGLPPLHCGGCSACCQGYDVYLTKHDDPSTYETDGLKLKRTSTGDCVYRTTEGCGIYERRPRACRDFDCRAFVAMHTYTQRRKMPAGLHQMVAVGRRRLLSDGDTHPR